MRILIIRHGESEANKDKKVQQTVRDHLIELTARGHNQTRKAGRFVNKYFEKNPPTNTLKKTGQLYALNGADMAGPKIFDPTEHDPKVRLYVSPFTRTMQSAMNIVTEADGVNWDLNTRHNNYPLFIDPFLVELNFGLFAGHDKETIKQHPLLDIFNRNFESFNNPKDGGGLLAQRPMGNDPLNVLMGCYVFMDRLMRAHNEEGIEDFVIVTSGATAKCLQICFTSDNPLNYDLISVPANASVRLIKTNPATHKNEYYGTIFNPNNKNEKNPEGRIYRIDDPEEPLHNDMFALYPDIQAKMPEFFKKYGPKQGPLKSGPRVV